jgi:hypothetical protein
MIYGFICLCLFHVEPKTQITQFLIHLNLTLTLLCLCMSLHIYLRSSLPGHVTLISPHPGAEVSTATSQM